jgi:iron complex outermembrane recepter protein
VKGLTVVTGAVLLDAKVTGKPVEDGRVGETPVDKPRTTFTFNSQYDIPFVAGLSVTQNATRRGERFADSLDRVKLPAVALVDLGVRYRFSFDKIPALLRFTVQNVGNSYDWQLVGSGGYQVYTARQFSLALTVDL